MRVLGQGGDDDDDDENDTRRYLGEETAQEWTGSTVCII